MSQTIIFSGPSPNVSQCRNALGGIGFKVSQTTYGWGLAPSPSGKTPKVPQSFITAYGDQLNEAVRIVEQYGFVLRCHFPDGAGGALVDMSAPTNDVADEVRALRAQVEALLKKAAS